MDILYLVMPAYNEEANIKKVVETWYLVLQGKHENSKLVIADSGSLDRIHIILAEMKKDYPKLARLLISTANIKFLVY